MASDFSFDIVSEIDLQAVDDAVNTANKEMSVRFDFRGSVSRVEFNRDKSELFLYSDNEGKLKSVVDVFRSRAAKRGIDLKAFDYGKVEVALGGKVKQRVAIQQGVNAEKAKRIVADIKKTKIKVTPSIQGDRIRVSSRSKDDLQEAITLVKGGDYGLPLQFINFR